MKKKTKETSTKPSRMELLTKPTTAFTQALAREIVRNFTTLGQITTRRFQRKPPTRPQLGEHPMLLDTSVLIDGRILSIVGFPRSMSSVIPFTRAAASGMGRSGSMSVEKVA